MQQTDQQRIEGFLKEWVASITIRFPKEIDFILLFGSAARGEFALGKSDVDLIIQTKNAGTITAINDFALEQFWKLDEKWGTQLQKVCSIGKGENALDELLKKIESNLRLYKPFEVFGPKDIDWKKGKILRKDLYWGAIWVASQLTLFYKIKSEGKVLYGRNILQEIRPQRSAWEKFKSLIIPQHLAFAGLLIALVLPKRAVGYSTKAVIWEAESALIVMNRFQSNRKRQIQLLQTEMVPSSIIASFSWKKFLQGMNIQSIDKKEVDWFLACLTLRQDFQGNGVEALRIAWKSLAWVMQVRFWASLKDSFR